MLPVLIKEEVKKQQTGGKRYTLIFSWRNLTDKTGIKSFLHSTSSLFLFSSSFLFSCTSWQMKNLISFVAGFLLFGLSYVLLREGCDERKRRIPDLKKRSVAVCLLFDLCFRADVADSGLSTDSFPLILSINHHLLLYLSMNDMSLLYDWCV